MSLGFKLGIMAAVIAVAAPAEAVRLTGRFTYVDKDRSGAVLHRPIAFATVDLLNNGGRLGQITTNVNGAIDIDVPAWGGWFAVNVYATNPAATVISGSGGPWAAQPGESAPIWRWSSTPSDVLDFSYLFVETVSVRNYNIAETIKRGFDYANARRDPHETDVIPQVPVSISVIDSAIGTRYNVPARSLLFNHADVAPDSTGLMNDFTILHEYTHFLEDMISNYVPVPTNHTGCRAAEVGSGLVNNPENTWPEAFADYLARVIPLVAPPDAQLTGPDNRLTSGLDQLENPHVCDALGVINVNGDAIGPDAIEDFVAAVLWDMFDQPIDGAFGGPNRDFMSGADTMIFQIFDHELDGADHPNIRRLHDAWVARGLDHAGLDRIMDGYMPGVVTDANNTIAGLTNVDLDDNGWGTAPDTEAIVWGPTGAANQQWTYFKGRLQNHNPSAAICLAADPFLGVLRPCDATAVEQWGFHGQIRAADGKCLEVDGVTVSIATCTGGANQLFDFDATGAIHAGVTCLELGPSSVFGAKCTGAPAQRWSRTDLGQLVAAPGGACLAVSTAQTTVPLAERTGTARPSCSTTDYLQRWQLVGQVVHSDGQCLSLPFEDVWWGDPSIVETCSADAVENWTYFADAR